MTHRRLLHHDVFAHALTAPNDRALILGDREITYGELDELTSRLARFLADTGAERGDRIAILAPKCPEAIVGILAALKGDCIYVPMDSSSPVSRLAKIIGASRPRWIFTVPECAALLDGMLGELGLDEAPTVVSLAEGFIETAHAERVWSTDAWHGTPADAPPSQARPEDPAHILFTSGSTGTPKGVVITHENVTTFVDWGTAHFGITAADRHSCHPPLHFDLSTFDIFATLGAGAELHLVPPEANLMPQKLAGMIRDAELTQWFSVPSILNYMAKFDVIEHGDFPNLERVLWCGEVLPTPTLIYFMERLPHVRFTNLYGPTEATIASTYYDVPAVPADPTEAIPIGVPCTGEDVVILDEHRKPVPTGEIGDLYIAGVGLSPGYWENPEQTAKVFVTDPADVSRRIYRTGDLARSDADGTVHFIGRADTQIKSRGYRIELGEIETALHTLDELDEAAVIAIATDGFEGWTICCSYTLKPDVAISSAALRKKLGTLVPKYMLPTRWRPLPVMPKNANGKIDRRALKESFSEPVTA